MRKFHEAKLASDPEVVVWGTGNPLREFLHVDDLADACMFLMENYDEPGHVNVGVGEDMSIGTLAHLLRDIVYPEARIVFDSSKPDGTPRKKLDVSKLSKLGWMATTPLRDGLESTYDWFTHMSGERVPVKSPAQRAGRMMDPEFSIA